MVLPRSLWLLFVCLLSWCCDAQEQLEPEDPDSESGPLSLVIWAEIENTRFMNIFKNIVARGVPGIYIRSIEIGKTMMKNAENQALDASSQVCQILAQDPKLQKGYIGIAFKGRKFLRSVAQRCPIPVMKDMISISTKNFLRSVKEVIQLYQTPANDLKTNQ